MYFLTILTHFYGDEFESAQKPENRFKKLHADRNNW